VIAGWLGDGADVDECRTILNDCSDKCVDTPGSFHCTCRTGFQAVGSYCYGPLPQLVDDDKYRVYGTAIPRFNPNSVPNPKSYRAGVISH